MKFTGENLVDSFEIHGNTIEGFKENVVDFEKTTHFKKEKSGNITLYSHIADSADDETSFLYKVGAKEVSIQPEINIRSLRDKGISLKNLSVEDSPKNLGKRYSGGHVKLRKSKLAEKGDFAAPLAELRNTTKLMLGVNDKIMFTTESLLTNLDRFGLKGGFLAVPSLARDILVEQELLRRNKDMTLVCRKMEGVEKCFSILSGKYTPISSKVVFSLIDRLEKEGHLGKAVCREWSISHFYTRIYFDFPDKACELTDAYGRSNKYIPGMVISTSDTGDCSLKVAGTFRVNDTLTVQDEILHKHIGEYDENKFVEKVTNEIFAEFGSIPDKLCDLMTIDIVDSSWDLSDAKDQMEYTALYKKLLDSCFNQLGITSAIGFKNKKALFDAMIEEFNPNIPLTAYDIATSIMELPSRITGASLPTLRKTVGKAAFVSFDIPTITLA